MKVIRVQGLEDKEIFFLSPMTAAMLRNLRFRAAKTSIALQKKSENPAKWWENTNDELTQKRSGLTSIG